MADYASDVHGKEIAKSGTQGDHQDALINRMAQENLLKPVSGQGTSLVSMERAPDGLLNRYGMVTLQGLANVPEGMYKAAKYDVTHPLETAETLGMAAGMAVVLKTVLPEGGLAGKIAGAAIGTYFTLKAAEPIVDGYKMAGNALTMKDMNMAATQIGDAGGSFIVNSAIAAVGYKAGSHLTDRVLSSQAMDGFADSKANFYDKLGKTTTRLTDRIGLTKPATDAPTMQQQIAGYVTLDPRMKFLPSEREAPPQALLKGDVDPNSPMQVSVMLKSKASDLKFDRTLSRIAQGRQAPLSDGQMGDQFGATQDSLDAVTKFASEHGLKISEANMTSGRVVLSGTAGQFTDAFKTRLAEYEHSSGFTFRGREGSLSVPTELNKHIVGILGMDDRPQFRSHAVKFAGPVPEDGPTEAPTPPGGLPKPAPGTDPRAIRSFMPDEVARAYNFPTDSMGKGQAVGIIELGGGIDLADNAQYYSDHNLPQPAKINVIEVGGAKNAPGGAADGEVLLDSQVIGVIAPEATQNLIFAPNSEKGFVDAITRATFPEKGEVPNSAISISWGQNEDAWTKQAIDGMNQAFKKAALKGISIFAASGDDGAMDNSSSSKVQVDYPASDPLVTGSGGTRLMVNSDGSYKGETTWNNHRANDSGGGGVSQVFPAQDFQKDVKVPPNANNGQSGRGVPDISGNADPVTGYRIRVGGFESQTGGTSAVSPLYSALMMRINGALGKPFGTPLNEWLYKNANSGIFNDVTSGDNISRGKLGYSAGPGWDAVTGLGSVDGTKMLNLMKSDPHIAQTFGQFRFVGPTTVTGDSTQTK